MTAKVSCDYYDWNRGMGDMRYTKAMTCRVSEYMEHNPECVTCMYTYQCKGGCRAGGTVGGGDMQADIGAAYLA